jgi:CheY-like chemotaxis protein
MQPVPGDSAEPAAAAARMLEVAHELRSPLGGIDSMIELLSRSQLDDTQKRLVEGLKSASRHLRAVAQGVIDPVRPNLPDVAVAPPDVEPRFHELRALLNEISVSADARAALADLRFEIRVARNVPVLAEFRPHHLRQMIENLLDNAFKHSVGGIVRLFVEGLDERGGFVGIKVSVTDSGPGIAPDQLTRLFRPYARVAGDGTPGTGLGLSIVERLARRSGGEAGAESVPGEGATFWFTLRLRTPATPGPGEAAGRRPVQHRVLVVDDNASSRVILSAILEHFGFAVETAGSGEEALLSLANRRFDAVTVDRSLPGIDGEAMVARLRGAGGPCAGVPVIAVTGHVLPEHRRAFEEAGANAFVAKPVTARALIDAVAAVGLPVCPGGRVGDAA